MAEVRTNFWISWWSGTPLDQFEYHGPWWISGMRDVSDDETEDSICAAVVAASEEEAKEIIRRSYDYPAKAEIEWRFAETRPADWAPFSSRFERADWMKWPWPTSPLQGSGS